MKIHMIGICGMGMGSLACLFKESGHEVSGSDSGIYPPMSTRLQQCAIPVKNGFAAEHIPRDCVLVIIGNVAKRDNPEVLETHRRNLRYLSFPGALSELYLGDTTNVVVAGTHGKTTTCSLIAWILHYAGLKPGFLIGGILRNFGASSTPGEGDYFVVEGDEYDTAYFDKGPKFRHYRPEIGVLTGMEFEHADIFPDFEAMKHAFAHYVELIPAEGRLIACGDYPAVHELCSASNNVVYYGEAEDASWRLIAHAPVKEGTLLTITHNGTGTITLTSPLSGRHNALNVVAALAVARRAGIPVETVREALMAFRGIKRRQEIRGEEKKVTVIDDFAHHPTEVMETINAVKSRYPAGRVWAVWEPRTNTSRRNFFQDLYPEAFMEADRVIIAGVYHPEQIEPERRFSPEKLVSALRARGRNARHIADVGTIVTTICDESRSGDAILVMSNGSFENIHERILEGLRKKNPS